MTAEAVVDCFKEYPILYDTSWCKTIPPCRCEYTCIASILPSYHTCILPWFDCTLIWQVGTKKMEAKRYSEMLVSSHQTRWRIHPDEHNTNLSSHDRLKSYTFQYLTITCLGRDLSEHSLLLNLSQSYHTALIWLNVSLPVCNSFLSLHTSFTFSVFSNI